ncbi:MAG: glycosyltransferase [Microthrixaceae bacterium]
MQTTVRPDPTTEAPPARRARPEPDEVAPPRTRRFDGIVDRQPVRNPRHAPAPLVDVVLPVHQEEVVVADSLRRLHDHLTRCFPFSWRITVVDNASTDRTWERTLDVMRRLDHVEALRLDRKGRGLAVRTAWAASDAAIVAYMDVDLSTGLDALLPLVAPLLSGHSDVAIGSRLSPGARVDRGPRREVISRCYNRMLRTLFGWRVHDAQCGFKALRTDVARRLLPHVEDDGWFFDTELLLLAEHNGLRIHEVPVDWVDDPDSRVQVSSTALGDLAGSARMFRRFVTGHGRVDLGPARRDGAARGVGRHVAVAAGSAIGLALTAVLLLVRPGKEGR